MYTPWGRLRGGTLQQTRWRDGVDLPAIGPEREASAGFRDRAWDDDHGPVRREDQIATFERHDTASTCRPTSNSPSLTASYGGRKLKTKTPSMRGRMAGPS